MCVLAEWPSSSLQNTNELNVTRGLSTALKGLHVVICELPIKIRALKSLNFKIAKNYLPSKEAPSCVTYPRTGDSHGHLQPILPEGWRGQLSSGEGTSPTGRMRSPRWVVTLTAAVFLLLLTKKKVFTLFIILLWINTLIIDTARDESSLQTPPIASNSCESFPSINLPAREQPKNKFPGGRESKGRGKTLGGVPNSKSTPGVGPRFTSGHDFEWGVKWPPPGTCKLILQWVKLTI